jgi:hypothetical protein
LYFPEESDKKMSQLEMFAALGLCVAPTVAGFLYGIGYLYTCFYAVFFPAFFFVILAVFFKEHSRESK